MNNQEKIDFDESIYVSSSETVKNRAMVRELELIKKNILKINPQQKLNNFIQ